MKRNEARTCYYELLQSRYIGNTSEKVPNVHSNQNSSQSTYSFIRDRMVSSNTSLSEDDTDGDRVNRVIVKARE